MIRRPVEHVVCGDGDQTNPRISARGRHMSAAEMIQPVRHLPFGLTAIHRGHGRAVDHRIGRILTKNGCDGFRRSDVRFRKIGRDNGKTVGKNTADGPAEHPLSAGQKNFFHFRYSGLLISKSSASFRSGLTVSLGERMKCSTWTFQSMPRAGSLKAIPRSWEGA